MGRDIGLGTAQTRLALLCAVLSTSLGAFAACSGSTDADVTKAKADGGSALPDGATDDATVRADGGDAGNVTEQDASVPPEGLPGLDPKCRDPYGFPKNLECTGLYSDIKQKKVADGIATFKPGIELWSDGAVKTRWILLPAGQKIDVSNPNGWKYPTGTRVWKEFRLVRPGGERRIETRFMVKLPDGDWYRTAYKWNADESQADELADGELEVPGTDKYEIPDQRTCARCHSPKMDNLLAFDGIGLSGAGATGLTYDELKAKGLLTSTNGKHELPKSAYVLGGTQAEREGAEYLHMNCGVSCHNSSTGGTQFQMDLELDDAGVLPAPKDTLTAKTAINMANGNLVTDAGAAGDKLYRIRPTDPARSTVRIRAGNRIENDTRNSMPPVGTHKVDSAGLVLIEAWINAMTTANGYPPPSP